MFHAEFLDLFTVYKSVGKADFKALYSLPINIQYFFYKKYQGSTNAFKSAIVRARDIILDTVEYGKRIECRENKCACRLLFPYDEQTVETKQESGIHIYSGDETNSHHAQIEKLQVSSKKRVKRLKLILLEEEIIEAVRLAHDEASHPGQSITHFTLIDTVVQAQETWID